MIALRIIELFISSWQEMSKKCLKETFNEESEDR